MHICISLRNHKYSKKTKTISLFTFMSLCFSCLLCHAAAAGLVMHRPESNQPCPCISGQGRGSPGDTKTYLSYVCKIQGMDDTQNRKSFKTGLFLWPGSVVDWTDDMLPSVCSTTCYQGILEFIWIDIKSLKSSMCKPVLLWARFPELTCVTIVHTPNGKENKLGVLTHVAASQLHAIWSCVPNAIGGTFSLATAAHPAENTLSPTQRKPALLFSRALPHAAANNESARSVLVGVNVAFICCVYAQ